MEFQVEERIACPREKVFETYRDHLEELVDYLPNVEAIEVQKREVLDDHRVRLVNFWQGTSNDVPKVARPFVKKEMTSWIDRALWDDESYTCRWEFEPSFLKAAVDCYGVNRYDEDGPDGTLLKIEVSLNIDLHKVRAVPGFLAKRARPIVEKYVADLVRPNLSQVSEGLRNYLAAKGG